MPQPDTRRLSEVWRAVILPDGTEGLRHIDSDRPVTPRPVAVDVGDLTPPLCWECGLPIADADYVADAMGPAHRSCVGG